MKKQFSPEAHAIWSQILGTKGFLSSNRIQNLVDILNRELTLAPVMVRYGDKFELYDAPKFLAFRVRDYPDGHVAVFYAPGDCGDSTGSAAHNWTQWATLLLKYGRKTHALAPWMRPPPDVLEAMEKKGQIGKVKKVTRFLSLEVVVFYLAAQTRTWGKPTRVLDVKDLIKKNDVSVISFPAPIQDPVNIDGMFPPSNDITAGAVITPGLPKTRVPKAGRGLVTYNPGTPAPAVRQTVNAPIAAPAVDLPSSTVGLMAVDTATLDDAGLEAYIAALQGNLEDRRARVRKAKFADEAAQAILLHGDEDTELWADRPQYATVTIRYPNGDEVSYYHQQLMDRMVKSAGSEALADAAEETEELEVGDLLAD